MEEKQVQISECPEGPILKRNDATGRGTPSFCIMCTSSRIIFIVRTPEKAKTDYEGTYHLTGVSNFIFNVVAASSCPRGPFFSV